MARRKNKRNMIVWGVVLIVLLIAGVCAGVIAWQNNQNTDTKKQDENNIMVEETNTVNDTTGDEVSGELTSTGVEKEKVVQYEGEDPNTAEELTGVVTYAGVNNGTLMIRTSIDQYLTSGNCELILENGGATIYSSIANIVGDITTAVCDGFDISAAGLGEGSIQIIINLSADGKTGVIRGEVEI